MIQWYADVCRFFRRTPGQACGRRCRYSVVTLWIWRPQRSVVFSSSLNAAMLAQSAAIFVTPIHTSFPHMLWKFHTQVTQGQVTRSRQKTLPQKSLNARHSYTEWLITLKLSAIDIPYSIYEIYISEFWYRRPQIRPIFRPLHYKFMVENWKAPC